MALRLAGEEFSVVRGLDAQGWPRLVDVSDAAPAMKVVQAGSGALMEFYDGSSKVLYMDDGGDLVLSGRALDVRNRIKNTGAADSGAVAVEDTLRALGSIFADSGDIGQTVLAMQTTHQAFYQKERTTHMADADVAEDFGYHYIYRSGTTRQLVVKFKDAGVVYTGTLNLS